MAKRNIRKLKISGEEMTNFKSFFMTKGQYTQFVSAMLEAKADNKLPIYLTHYEPMNITMTDVQEFINTFKEDTGLYIEIRATTCDCCGEVKLSMVVDTAENFYNNAITLDCEDGA